jgi:nitroreductase
MENKAIKLLQDRRSIRSIDPERQISEEELQELVKVALNTPSAHNRQLYHFSVVQDAALLEHMADLIRQQMLKGNEAQRQKASAPGFSPLHHAPTVIFVSGELSASSYVQTDCGIGVGLVTAAATQMGLATCITGSSLFMFDSEEGSELKKTLQIPDSYKAICAIAVGYLKGEAPQPPEKKPAEELVSYVR